MSWIYSDPETKGGAPVIRGTRLTVSAIKVRLIKGETIEQLMEEYPYIPREAFDEAARYSYIEVPSAMVHHFCPVCDGSELDEANHCDLCAKTWDVEERLARVYVLTESYARLASDPETREAAEEAYTEARDHKLF